MAYARDQVPRSDMTPDQRRRIGSLQAAKRVITGEGYGPNRPQPSVAQTLRLAKWIEKGE